ncbi:hypothetical protein P171DRAFT_336698, partial [Karstenula rhodostoma CBS 690.94]
MGIDEGFDMVPPLSKGVADRRDWDQFIAVIMDHYKDDPKVEVRPNYIFFNAGEGPILPSEGYKLLRFSSKISGSTAHRTGVEAYLFTVTRLAKQHFGSRVQHWNDGVEVYGTYSWDEVNDSFGTYEQPDKPEVHPTDASVTTGLNPIKESTRDIRVFEIKDITGKGKGLVARCDISKGLQILCEKPLFTARSTQFNDIESMLARKLGTLPKDVQRQFLSFHNHSTGKNPFTNTFKTNALPCGVGSAVGAIYPTICRINHSCFPNAHNSWDDDAGHETIYAIRPIKSG